MSEPIDSDVSDTDHLRFMAIDAAGAWSTDEVEAVTSAAYEIDRLRSELVEARLEASWWRQIAWLEGFPRDSHDRHQWETFDEYRAVLNDESWNLVERPERRDR